MFKLVVLLNIFWKPLYIFWEFFDKYDIQKNSIYLKNLTLKCVYVVYIIVTFISKVSTILLIWHKTIKLPYLTHTGVFVTLY